MVWLSRYVHQPEGCQRHARTDEHVSPSLRHSTSLVCFQIAAWLVGNSLPRNKAVQMLWQQLQAQKATCHTEVSLSNCVIDLATRKSYGVKGGQKMLHTVLPAPCTLSCSARLSPQYISNLQMASVHITHVMQHQTVA